MAGIQQAQAAVTVSVFVQRFSATRRGARVARVLASHQLDAWGIAYDSEASDTVTLVVAELANNAVQHGRVPGRDFMLRLAYERARGRDRDAALLRVEVSDTHDSLPVAGGSGYGLVIVDALTLRWGVSGRSGPGKTVWGVVPVGGGLPAPTGRSQSGGSRPASRYVMSRPVVR